MPKRKDPVVASLPNRSPHPYSAIAMSPNREYAIVAGKDTIQLVKIDPSGLKSLRSLKISQYFQIGVPSADGRPQVGKKHGDVRDTFARPGKQPARPAGANMTHANIVITCVAWSMPQVKSEGEELALNEEDQNTLVAAAGSNGVVVIWSARQAFFSQTSAGGSSTMAHQQPEATLSQHTRAVNSLAWHPKRPGLLLTASQDALVKLWERRTINQQSNQEQNKSVRSWFGNMTSARSQPDRAYSWFCRATFEPKSEAVRDMQWSKFQDDVFALVTVSGSLIVYNMHVSARALVKIAAHTGDATSLDWHPTKPYVIATGGAGDRCVKVWDLESSVNMDKRDDSNIALNANTLNTVRSDVSTNSYSSTETDRSVPSSIGSIGGTSVPIGTRGFSGSSGSGHGVSRHKTSSAITLHVLSISASVTKLRWRPPALDTFASNDDGVVDRHDSMLAVATARLTSAGGSGVLSLWTFHRPFMPLSVVEGHEEGAVTDFVWLDTPQLNKKAEAEPKSNASSSNNGPKNSRRGQPKSAAANDIGEVVALRSSGRDADSLFDNKEKETEQKESSAVHVWQHVLSVGRDGRCILESFARGDRPISRVPSSCFSMANVSPFFPNCGSLQFFSVYQAVPRGPKHDFLLTGLRQDEYTKQAPGVFKEMPADDSENNSDEAESQWAAGKRLPATVPDVVFNVVDQGDLDENGLPLGTNDKSIAVAPEVLHLSRFTNLYKLYPDNRLPTRVDLCLHNGNVAEDLRCGPLARMWRSVASMLNGSGMDELPLKGASSQPINVMQFALLPTIKSLLEERAEAGDVQSCVAVCEVLQVIQPDQQIRIPGLELNLVREWYLSYIDLLQHMCLFSSASLLIRSCNDPFIGALNQQSTTIHESCPRCGKPLQPSTDGAGSTLRTSARRACKNCRRRVGLCFLCHEPVKGMFVWCPGCGHGGHLDHALQWFGGQSGKSVREVCPTGCGHKCNLSQTLSAFPRTDSLMCLPTQMEGGGMVSVLKVP